MPYARVTLLLVGLLVPFGSAAHASTIFMSTITTDQEPTDVLLTLQNGAPRPSSFGTASFVLNDAMTALTMTATIFNIDVTGTQTPDVNDNLAAAHIHAPAPPGVNAGVRWGFFGAPDNDNNPDNLVVTPFATGVGGTFQSTWDAPEGNVTTLSEQLPSLLAGLAYINFHTVQNPGGEIRGQMIRVPEPLSTLLIGLGAAAAAGIVRRRR